MITNNSVTIYHKTFDKQTRLEKWTRFNYKNVWFFGGKSAIVNDGYDPNNKVEVRIPLSESINIDNFSIGDIIVESTLSTDIETQQDLKNYQVYNITNINVNDFGTQPHIHLGGK